MSLRLFSRAWQEITKLKKNYDKLLNIIFHPFAGGPCWADCSNFLRVGWHPRRNHAYHILSRSRRGYGATGVQNRGFPIHFQTAVTTVFRTTVLHCDNRLTVVFFELCVNMLWLMIWAPELSTVLFFFTRPASLPKILIQSTQIQ